MHVSHARKDEIRNSLIFVDLREVAQFQLCDVQHMPKFDIPKPNKKNSSKGKTAFFRMLMTTEFKCLVYICEQAISFLNSDNKSQLCTMYQS